MLMQEVSPFVFAGRVPVTKKDWAAVSAQRISTVINLTGEANDKFVAELGGFNGHHYHFPVRNYCAPSSETLTAILDIIQACVEERRGVLVHCLAGRGRTGTVLACYFGKLNGWNADEALRKMREMRPGSVESKEQEKAVHSFIQ